ncbi:MAG: addiction module antitoxin [Rhizobium sp. 63-7]|nr:MAG: addiction module antitoxin [Rhizobium sp. 63-7]
MSDTAHLGQHLEEYVDELVKSGRYTSRNDVLREGVRLVEEREKRLKVLDAAIERGLADADAGRKTTAGEIASRLAAKYEMLAEARGM